VGPGSLRTGLLDNLYSLNRSTVLQKIRIQQLQSIEEKIAS
jgi:hypothetical protein